MSNRRRKPKGRAKKLKKLKDDQQSGDSRENPSEHRSISGEVGVRGTINVNAVESQETADRHINERNQDDSYRQHTSMYEDDSRKIAKRTLLVSTAYLIATLTIIIYTIKSTTAAIESAHTASRALDLAFESTRAVLATEKVNFEDGVKVGKRTVLDVKYTNVGHSIAQNGVNGQAERWTEMPSGDMPIGEPELSSTLEPGKLSTTSVMDPLPASQDEIEQLPTFTDVGMKRGFIPTTYFFGRFTYETLGKRYHGQFCYYLVKADQHSREFKMDMPDQEFFPVKCPKWNSSQ